MCLAFGLAMASQAYSATLGLTDIATYYVPGLTGSIEDVRFNDTDSDGSPEILACDGETLVLYCPNTDMVVFEKPLDPRQMDYALIFEDVNRDLIPDIVIGCYFEAGNFGPDTVCLLEFYDGATGYSTSDSFFFEAQIELALTKSSPFSFVDFSCTDINDDGFNDFLFSYDRYRTASMGFFDVQTTMGQTSRYTNFPDQVDWDRTVLLSNIHQAGTFETEKVLVGTRYSTFSLIPGDIEATGWVEFISGGGDSVASIGQTTTSQCHGDSSIQLSTMELICIGDIHPNSDDQDIVVRSHWSQTCYTDDAVSFDSSMTTTRLYRLRSLDEIDLLWSDLNPAITSNIHYLTNFPGYFFGAKDGTVYKMSGLNGEIELTSDPLDVDTILWRNESDLSGGDLVTVKNQTLEIYTVDMFTDVNSVDNSSVLPESFHLGQPYPNPFNPSCVIEYSISERAYTTIAVYNILGHKVASLVDGIIPAGNHRAVWNGTDQSGKPVASGIYLYRMEAGEFVDSRKMLLLK